MRILVLGGTWFLGRVVVETALADGHEVTTFNRGQSGPDVPGVRAVRGDRTDPAALAALAEGREWDAVIDTSGQVPRVVEASARALAGRVGRYVFVSTVSVYQGWPVEPLAEDSAVLECPADAGPEYGQDDPRGYPTQYGFLKAGCERAVTEIFEDALVIRPGVILGRYEYVGRLPWWLSRIARGGPVLAPGDPGQSIQPIDVRDVAAFALHGVAGGVAGTVNLTAPRQAATFGSFLADCVAVTGSDAELEWVEDEFLIDHHVRQWTELPLWRTYRGTWDVAAEGAVKAGLVCRPLRQTVADTWEWLTSGGGAIAHERRSEIGLDPSREAELLAGWRATRR